MEDFAPNELKVIDKAKAYIRENLTYEQLEQQIDEMNHFIKTHDWERSGKAKIYEKTMPFPEAQHLNEFFANLFAVRVRNNYKQWKRKVPNVDYHIAIYGPDEWQGDALELREELSERADLIALRKKDGDQVVDASAAKPRTGAIQMVSGAKRPPSQSAQANQNNPS